jgi:small subunit ribosomal protein S9
MEVFKKTGRRKTAVARIGLSKGTGKIVVNNKPINEYFANNIFVMYAKQPLDLLNEADKYDIWVNVYGGGLSAQANAIKLAIARAICEVDAEKRPELKQHKMLTRDSRMVERKKPGYKKARKSFQFSKR